MRLSLNWIIGFNLSAIGFRLASSDANHLDLLRYFVQMFHRDHGPPHVHAKYHGSEAQVRISDGEIQRGFLPPTARRLVKRWVLRYKTELELNWRRGQALEPLERIPGLEDDQDHLD